MQHWNSFSTLYTPFQSYFLPVNHILSVRVGKTGQYWWVIVYNSLRTHDLHQYKSFFFILCFLNLNPHHGVPFKRSLMEVPKEVNMWNPALFRSWCKQKHTWSIVKMAQRRMAAGDFYRFKLQLGKPMTIVILTWGHKQVKSTHTKNATAGKSSCVKMRKEKKITHSTQVF